MIYGTGTYTITVGTAQVTAAALNTVNAATTVNVTDSRCSNYRFSSRVGDNIRWRNNRSWK